MEIDCTLDLNFRFARVHSVLIRRNRGAIRERTATTRRLPLGPKFERTGTSGNDGVPCQRALVGDSSNDE